MKEKVEKLKRMYELPDIEDSECKGKTTWDGMLYALIIGCMLAFFLWLSAQIGKFIETI